MDRPLREEHQQAQVRLASQKGAREREAEPYAQRDQDPLLNIEDPTWTTSPPAGRELHTSTTMNVGTATAAFASVHAHDFHPTIETHHHHYATKTEKQNGPLLRRLKPTLASFIGRTALLRDMHNHLLAEGDQVALLRRRVLLLHGPSGIGKSELAIEFANRHLSAFSHVWTIDCESTLASYRDLAESLNIITQDIQDDAPMLIRRVHARLESMEHQKPWLLIFDGVADVNTELPTRGCIVIATSQISLVWGPEVEHNIEVPSFDMATTRMLLEKVIPARILEMLLPPARANEICERLLCELGSSTYMLFVAARSLRGGLFPTVDTYLRMVGVEGVMDSHDTKDRYPFTQQKALELAIKQLVCDNEAAAEFLGTVALHLNVNQIHVSLIHAWICTTWLPQHPSFSANSIPHAPYLVALLCLKGHPLTVQTLGEYACSHCEKKGHGEHHRCEQCGNYTLCKQCFDVHRVATLFVDRIITSLQDHSLSRYDPLTRSLSLHQLLRTVLLRMITGKGRSLLCVIHMLANWRLWHHNWRLFAQIVAPHLEALFGSARWSLEDSTEGLSASLSRLGVSCHECGMYNLALTLHETALAVQEKQLPVNHPMLAVLSNNIAELYERKGDYPKALPLHERILKVRKEVLPPNHPEIAVSLNNIAALHKTMGNYEKAIELHKCALAIRERALPSGHSDIATSLNNLAAIYERMGDNDKALELLQRVLAIDEAASPANCRNIAVTLNNIGTVYMQKGAHDKAREFHEKALDLQQNTLPATHSDLAVSLNCLATVGIAVGNFKEARKMSKQALEIWQRILPDDHPNVAMAISTIAETYDSAGDYEKALELYHKALSIFEKSVHRDYRSIASLLNHTAEIYLRRGAYYEAVVNRKKALACLRRVLPPNHTTIINTENAIRSIYITYVIATVNFLSKVAQNKDPDAP